eukprot:TRINITY_DN5665_c0_g1_i1.p1 TRINITY_DN5665_c0_g1~~TRINITY_DN5665_c0_g1_i1.p1  ORF type:complete len:329 (+),score=84.62 TRINITY_DN5665_c0_g1_i1:106-1092(+)
MEVTVLEAQGPPSRPVLAVSSGAVRRQAKLQVNQPFVIPHPRGKSSIEVSLFQQLACQVLPESACDEAVCSIPVRRPDGGSSQVKLRLSRSDSLPAKEAKPSPLPSPPVEQFPSKPPVEDEEAARTRQYLEQHQLQYCIQGLIQDVLQEQPTDPYRYMLQQLRRCQGGGDVRAPVPTVEAATQNAARIEEQSKLMPHPPAGPKPGGPGGRRRPGSQSETEQQEQQQRTMVARCVLGVVLRAPEVLKAGEDGLRQEAQLAAATRLTERIMGASRERVVREAASGSSKSHQVAAILHLAYDGAAQYLSPQARRATNQLMRSLCYQGAVAA